MSGLATPLPVNDPLHGLSWKQRRACSQHLCDGLPLAVIGLRMPRPIKKSAVSRLVSRALETIEKNGYRWTGSGFVPAADPQLN